MKEFLRPSWAKIIIMLLLPLYIGYVVEVIDVQVGTSIVQVVQEGWRVTILPYLALMFGAIAVLVGNENYFDNLARFGFTESIGYFFLETILPLVINYLIAAALVALVKKLFPQLTAKRVTKKSPPPEEAMEL